MILKILSEAKEPKQVEDRKLSADEEAIFSEAKADFGQYRNDTLIELYDLFKDEEEYFESLSSHKELGDKPSFWTEWNEVKNPKWNTKDSSNFSNNFTTKIIGSQPDVTSFRHFVSLDTRSREVRNKKETTKNLNLILRTYQSSVGKEIFISYEDELGYLYGFTRLLLPLETERLVNPYKYPSSSS